MAKPSYLSFLFNYAFLIKVNGWSAKHKASKELIWWKNSNGFVVVVTFSKLHGFHYSPCSSVISFTLWLLAFEIANPKKKASFGTNFRLTTCFDPPFLKFQASLFFIISNLFIRLFGMCFVITKWLNTWSFFQSYKHHCPSQTPNHFIQFSWAFLGLHRINSFTILNYGKN